MKRSLSNNSFMRENHSGRLEIMQPRDAKDPDDEVEDPFHGENGSSSDVVRVFYSH